MATAIQIAANQTNAQLSTGPRTEAGKRASRLNAVQHGLTGQHILRTPEEDAAYKTYSDRLINHLAPANPLEQDFAERIVFDSWRLHRAGIVSQHLVSLADAAYDTGNAEQDEPLNEAHAWQANEKSLNLISLYSQRLDRAIAKNLLALKAMQKERLSTVLKPSLKPAVNWKAALQALDKSVPSVEFGFARSSTPADAAPPPAGPETNRKNMAA